MGDGKCCHSAEMIKKLKAKVPPNEEVSGQAAFLKAISDPTRIKILYALTGGDLCVCEIMASVDVPQTVVSHHCKILKFAGLIADHKSGKWVNYSLVNRRVIEVLNVIKDSD